MDSIEIKGRKFIFKIPSARCGCAIFNMIASYKLPFGVESLIGIKSRKEPIPPDQLEVFMNLCLINCFEVKDNPEETKKPIEIQVVDEGGGIGIIGGMAPLLTKINAQYLFFFVDYWQAESN